MVIKYTFHAIHIFRFNGFFVDLSAHTNINNFDNNLLLYSDLNEAVIDDKFPKDCLFWVSSRDSNDGKEGMLK